MQTILRALAEVSQARVAERMGTSETTISRLKDADLARTASLLAACGLKVVPQDHECWAPGYLADLRRLLAVELSRSHTTSDFGQPDF